MPSTILLLEPDEALAELLARFLHSRGHHVLQAATLQAAERLSRQVECDLAIVDLALCPEQGQRLWQSHSICHQLSPLFLAASLKEAGLVRSLGPVLVKPFRLDELGDALSTFYRAEEPTQASLVPSLNHLRVEGGSSIRLTNTESQLLDHLANEPGQFFPTRRLLREVWGYPDGVGNPGVVRVHVSNLRRKLRQIDPMPSETIQTVPGRGYRLIPLQPNVKES